MSWSIACIKNNVVISDEIGNALAEEFPSIPTISYFTEELNQNKQINIQLQDENSDLIKEIRNCKKIIREKENEINELKNPI